MIHINMDGKTPTAACWAKLKEKAKQIRKKLRVDQPFSAVARECISACGYPLVQKIVTT